MRVAARFGMCVAGFVALAVVLVALVVKVSVAVVVVPRAFFVDC